MAYGGLMVSVSGIRGKVGEALTPEVVATFAAAFGAWAARNGNQSIVVGRDSRVSGPMFARVVHAALQSVGCNVIDVGMVPTPTVQMAVEHHAAAGGLAITASHNPVEWNALKFVGPSGMFLTAEEGEQMRLLLDTGIPRATWDKLGEVVQDTNAVRRHIDAVLALPYLNVEAIRARNFRVALDCCHGAGSTIMPELLSLLGCETIAINMEPTGRFHRSPEPVAENLKELEKLVANTGADLGFATDPDVDRLALVSERATAIGEDYTLALAARVVLKHRPGGVVTNLSTSRVVTDVANEFEVPFHFAKVGEVNVALKMRDEGATIGGEGNGGVILPELHLGRDAPLGAALLLQLLLEENQPLSALVAARPRYVIVKDKLDVPAISLDQVYLSLQDQYPEAKADSQDGLRLDWTDRWVHLRPSGTEPIIRIIAEGPAEADARLLVERVRTAIVATASKDALKNLEKSL